MLSKPQVALTRVLPLSNAPHHAPPKTHITITQSVSLHARLNIYNAMLIQCWQQIVLFEVRLNEIDR